MDGRRCFAQAFSLVQLADTMQGLRLQTLQCGQSLGRGIPAYTLLVGAQAQKVFVKKLESCQCSHFFKVPGVHEFAPPGIYVRTFVETALAYATPTRPRFGQCPEFVFVLQLFLKAFREPRANHELPPFCQAVVVARMRENGRGEILILSIFPYRTPSFGFLLWWRGVLGLCRVGVPPPDSVLNSPSHRHFLLPSLLRCRIFLLAASGPTVLFQNLSISSRQFCCHLLGPFSSCLSWVLNGWRAGKDFNAIYIRARH